MNSRIPVATYRLQFHQQFRFRDALALLDYLEALGITDCYASPFLTARAGSTHGYDICDHNHVNPEIGTEHELATLCAALRARAMGLMLDFVPNHMGIDPHANPWWRDVLRYGERSRYAHFFDIDWHPLKDELEGKILLPLLGDQYGVVLERGELQLREVDGEVVLAYFDHQLPLDPETLPDMPLAEINGRVGEPASFDRLHELLERQAYRLAYWRTASHEINYRRFFDINELAGLRMEDEEVFAATHQLILRLIAAGQLTGLRLDHVDGLHDPRRYLERLQDAIAGGGDAAPRFYVVVEKILSAGECLPANWPVAGTSGYDFLNDVNRLFVDASRERVLRRSYQRFTGNRESFADVVYESKKLIMDSSMASELNVLAYTLNALSEQDRRTRDFTLNSLRDALQEVIACFPVYRTYVDGHGFSAGDQAAIDTAIRTARRRAPTAEPSIYRFVRDALLPDAAADEARRAFAMEFQQYTGPLQAKGVEDTAFYRYNLLLSLNEVGGAPQQFGASVDEFHRANGMRSLQWPHALLASATHDTKRGEDARARLNVLSEIPGEWGANLALWSRLNRGGRRLIEGVWAPDRNEEYLFYQSLLGALPAELDETPWAPDDGLIQRLQTYMTKALREAKRHTSWGNPALEYEAAVENFVRHCLSGAAAERFWRALLPFHRRVAQLGMINSLAQLVVKIGSPGVADFYQGSELWDLSLVDPDNRRPVDYDRRRRLLAELTPLLSDELPAQPRLAAIAELMGDWHSGGIKMLLTAAALRFRRAHAELFLAGSYEPLSTAGEHAENIVAFARRWQDDAVLVVAPRLIGNLATPSMPLPLGAPFWGDTVLSLPDDLASARWRNLITREELPAPEAATGLPLSQVLRVCPVAMLVPTARVKGSCPTGSL